MAKKKKVAPKPKSERLNLLVRADLKKWAHKYADKRGTSVSAMVTEFLYNLREEDRGARVEQI